MDETTHIGIMKINLAQCEEALQAGIHDLVDRKFIQSHIEELKAKIKLEEWEKKREIIRKQDTTYSNGASLGGA